MSAKSPLQPAKSGRAGATLGLGCAIPFGGVFFCAGCFALWMMTLQPLGQWTASRSWQPAEAVVLSSKLAMSKGSKNDTYRVAIRYRYDWPPRGGATGGDSREVLGAAPSGGRPRTHESERYDFSSGSTNIGVAGMRAVVDAHPPGTRVTCFVDPDDPSSAVINRSLPLITWIGLGFSCPFIVAGLGIIGLAWHSRRKAVSRPPVRADGAVIETNANISAGPSAASDDAKLAPAEGRAGAFLGIGAITLFWNGIVSVFVIVAFKEFGSGGFIGWFLPIFLIPFVCVGAVLLVAFGHAIARLFSPPVHVWLETRPPRLGAPAALRWQVRGAARDLRVSLCVYEEATYRVGTNSTTDRRDILRETLLDSADALALREGRLTVPLPADGLPPAFHGPNNRVAWELVFKGDIPRRADLDDRFHLPVAAPATTSSATFEQTPAAHEGDGVTLWTVTRFAPGDPLVLTVARTTGDVREPLTARLGWFTEGRGSTDSAIVWSEPLPHLAPGENATLQTTLPTAPWSFSGELVCVEWRLEIVDRKNRPLAHASLVVAPGGERLVLRAALPEEKTTKAPWWRFIPLPKR